MKLKIKDDYKQWSFGGGRQQRVKLTNLHPSQYEFYFKIYPEFFEVIEEPKATKTQNNDIKDDTNK